MSTEQPTNRPERRRTRRISFKNRCWIAGSRSALYTQARNISRGGLSVAGISPFKEGEEVLIKILGNHRRPELVVKSRVIWIRGDQDPAPKGMGAEFLEIISGDHYLNKILDSVEE